jgi:hypothetical protein
LGNIHQLNEIIQFLLTVQRTGFRWKRRILPFYRTSAVPFFGGNSRSCGILYGTARKLLSLCHNVHVQTAEDDTNRHHQSSNQPVRVLCLSIPWALGSQGAMRRIKKITQTIEVEEEEKNAIERLFSSFFLLIKKENKCRRCSLFFFPTHIPFGYKESREF